MKSGVVTTARPPVPNPRAGVAGSCPPAAGPVPRGAPGGVTRREASTAGRISTGPV
ncbi:hypothetical protein [Lentzea jiangxiensis]|uniref:hypothetical protein n=1 Tax=Lentzea jiangxiensis TaxID=641025 RepID=UPI0015A23C86|nr:hypothetical protein [Lentzea jiangxiensis]